MSESIISTEHPDYGDLGEIRDALYAAAGSRQQLEEKIPCLIRRGLWEVIDTPRTARVWLSEIEKTEKTYIGTKIEILVRDFFGFPKGVLDLRIGGHDVDVKNSVRRSWMIPMEAVGKVCLLVAEDDVSSKCWFGLIRARSEYLNLGRNRDSKSSISREGLRNVLWLISGGPMPQNFWSGVPAADIAAIMDSRCGATERLRRLFSMIKATPISRDVVCGVARQLDYMKRIRKNGGARDPLAREGIAVLSGNYDAELISALGLPRCAPDAFISYAATGCEDRRLLRDGGHPVCDGLSEANP